MWDYRSVIFTLPSKFFHKICGIIVRFLCFALECFSRFNRFVGLSFGLLYLTLGKFHTIILLRQISNTKPNIDKVKMIECIKKNLQKLYKARTGINVLQEEEKVQGLKKQKLQSLKESIELRKSPPFQSSEGPREIPHHQQPSPRLLPGRLLLLHLHVHPDG